MSLLPIQLFKVICYLTIDRSIHVGVNFFPSFFFFKVRFCFPLFGPKSNFSASCVNINLLISLLSSCFRAEKETRARDNFPLSHFKSAVLTFRSVLMAILLSFLFFSLSQFALGLRSISMSSVHRPLTKRCVTARKRHDFVKPTVFLQHLVEKVNISLQP